MIVGKLAGKVIGLGYMLVIILLTGTVIRETLMLYYGTEILRYTPQAIVLILIIFTTTYGVVAGIEVIARTLNLYWIMLTIIFIVYLGLAIPFGKLDCLLPVGEAGLLTILKSSLLPQAYTAELFLLAMLLPYCRSSREAFTAGNIANLGITFIFIMIMIASVAVMGEKTTARALFTPFYLADFIQPVGIKVFLIFIWGIGVWGKTALMQFTLTDGISQIIGLKEHRPVFWPIAIILMISSITMYQNAIEVLEKVSHIFPGMMLIFGYLIPTLLLIIALIKRKFSNQWMKDLKSSA